MHHPRLLLGAEKARSVGEIVEQEESHKGDGNGQEAFQNENPTPPFLTCDSIHFHNCVCQQARKGACDASRAEEETLAEGEFFGAVP